MCLLVILESFFFLKKRSRQNLGNIFFLKIIFNIENLF